jgi:hypothetical protein
MELDKTHEPSEEAMLPASPDRRVNAAPLAQRERERILSRQFLGLTFRVSCEAQCIRQRLKMMNDRDARRERGGNSLTFLGIEAETPHAPAELHREAARAL